jgi:hypothetical protein
VLDAGRAERLQGCAKSEGPSIRHQGQDDTAIWGREVSDEIISFFVAWSLSIIYHTMSTTRPKRYAQNQMPT